jgi:hypothetical protein
MRTFVGLGVLMLAAACASTPPPPPKPPTPTEMLTAGQWTCETKAGQATLHMKPTYKADGTASIDLQISSGSGGVAIEAAGTADGKWQLLEGDTKLQQTLSGLKLTSVKLNGADMDPSQAQGMIGSSIAGQSTTGPVTITPTSLEVGGDSKTSCTRPAA